METLEYIEAYFQQTLDKEQKESFEKRCESDNNFAQEVAFYITSRQAIREQLLEQKKSQWTNENSLEESIPSIAPVKNLFMRKWLSYAAAACVLLIISFLVFERPESAQQLASTYISQNLSQISQTMDGGKDSLQQGIAEYNNQQYDKALQLFEAVYTAHPERTDAKKYAGFVYLETKDYDKALQQFDELANIKGLFSNPGIFYKALTLLQWNKEGDKEKAKQFLQQVVVENLGESEKAKELLMKF